MSSFGANMSINNSIQTRSPGCVVQEAVTELLAQGGVRTLGVCGLGGIGKSTICRSTAEQYSSDLILVETDWYLALPSSVRKTAILDALQRQNTEEVERWSDPSSWYDWTSFVSDIDRLRRKGELQLHSAWRQSTGEKDLRIDLRVRNLQSALILVDGIYLLHPPIRALLDRVIVIEDIAENARKRAKTRDAHRAEGEYLAFKAALAESFDVPYFQKWCGSASIRVEAREATEN